MIELSHATRAARVALPGAPMSAAIPASSTPDVPAAPVAPVGPGLPVSPLGPRSTGIALTSVTGATVVRLTVAPGTDSLTGMGSGWRLSPDRRLNVATHCQPCSDRSSDHGEI